MGKIKKNKKKAKYVPTFKEIQLAYSIKLVERAAEASYSNVFDAQLDRMNKELKDLKQS